MYIILVNFVFELFLYAYFVMDPSQAVSANYPDDVSPISCIHFLLEIKILIVVVIPCSYYRTLIPILLMTILSTADSIHIY